MMINDDTVIFIIHNDGEQNGGNNEIHSKVNTDFAFGGEPFDEDEGHPDKWNFLQQRPPGLCPIENSEPGNIDFQDHNDREKDKRLSVGLTDPM
ncbi:hypothetical protein D3C77_350680 [compost metagenome]